MTSIIPVILCGGSGSRLWPASREAFPKQFLVLSGSRSLFQDTIARVTDEGFGRPLVVTGADYRFLVAEQLRQAGVQADIVLEPCRRDSCAAIAAAALVALQRDPEALLLVLAADHAIPDKAAFAAHVRRGVVAAEAGRIVTFGMRPDHAATGYGYIRPGAEVDGAPGVRDVAAFVEKPDLATAERYLAEGYLWNSGNFLFRATVFLSELGRLAPGIAGPVGAAVAAARRDLDFLRLDPEAFARSEQVSVDFAVMEKTALAAVVPSEFGWSDIGAWAAVWDLAPKDEAGNAAFGDGRFVGSRGSYIHSPDCLTAVVGLDDVVVVTTPDAVLVAAKDRTQEVKGLVGRLVGERRREAIEHREQFRPWGSVDSIGTGQRYQVKKIRVKPGARLSLQSHVHRSEHWVVVGGTARVTLGDEVRLLTENESIYIPLGAVHRLENPGRIPLELVEIQSGTYLAEDDVVRYEDDYERS